MKETQSPGWKICVEAPKCDPAVPRRPTDRPLTGVARTAKLNGSEVTLDPNKNSAQTDPTRPAHLSLRILSCVCAGTFRVCAATRGKSQEGVSLECHSERSRGAGALDFNVRALLNWRASSQLRCLYTP